MRMRMGIGVTQLLYALSFTLKRQVRIDLQKRDEARVWNTNLI